MFGAAGSANVSIIARHHQQRVMNDCCLSTTDLLDILPYTIEEAAQQSQLLDCSSLSVIEALQSALNDSHNDGSFASLQQAQKSVPPIGNNSNDWYTDLHPSPIMPDSFYKEVQRHAVRTNDVISLPSKKQHFQGKLKGVEKHPTVQSKDLPKCQLYKNGEVQVHNFESWPTSSQLHHPFVEVNSGFVVRLRGYEESMEACQNTENSIVTTVKCCCCQAILKCMHDAEFVLCQSCRFISPVRPLQRDSCCPNYYTGPNNATTTDAFGVGGGLAVGLLTTPTSQKSNNRNHPASHKKKKRTIMDAPGLEPWWKKAKHVV